MNSVLVLSGLWALVVRLVKITITAMVTVRVGIRVMFRVRVRARIRFSTSAVYIVVLKPLFRRVICASEKRCG